MANTGRMVYPQQPGATTNNDAAKQRMQKSFAMTIPGGYSASSDVCYEGMMTCFGCVCGTLGSFPCLFCFPKYLMFD